MIAYIKGTLVTIQENAVIIDVGGIGYEVIHPDPFGLQSSLHESVFINTYHHIREDNEVLYGFRNDDEKSLFIKLISVSGIGPKGALAVIGSTNADSLIKAIEQEDNTFLTSLPGIGKKTARQIILDLKEELSNFTTVSSESSSSSGAPVDELHETEEALKSLGYTEREIKEVIPKLSKEENQSTDYLIRQALAWLMEK